MSNGNNSKRAPTDGETGSTGSDDGSKSSKGSNHPLGAVSGAMQKLSSPIGDKFRKVARKGDSTLQESDHSAVSRGTPNSDKKKLSHHRHHTDGGSGHNPMKDVADFFGEGGKHIKRLVHHKGSKSRDDFSSTTSRGISDDENQDSDGDLPAVPPDDTLKEMNIIINRRLKDISIPNYYAAAWSEDTTGNEQEPLYRSFLEESGKENIVVGEWEVAEAGNEFVGDWDGEKYTHKRVSYLCHGRDKTLITLTIVDSA
jgi:hypothetical protein